MFSICCRGSRAVMELAHSQALLQLYFDQEEGVKPPTQPGLVLHPAAKSHAAPGGRLSHCLSLSVGYVTATFHLALNPQSEQNKIK